MVRFDGDDRISRNEVTCLRRVLNRKRSLEWISLIFVAAGQGVFAVDQIIKIGHAIVILENGRYRKVLKPVPSIRATRIETGTGNQISAIGKLELKKTDGDGIEIEQGIRHRAVRTLNLYATIGSGVVHISGPTAWSLWADG